MSRTPNWKWRALLFAIVGLVEFGLLNGLAWAVLTRSPSEAPRSWSLVYPDLDAPSIRTLLEETSSRRRQYAPFIEHRERPFAGQFVNIHPAGFRESRDQGPWPPERERYFTVFLFGGSTAFGYGLPDSQTIASFLQARLNTTGLSRPVRVYNFGQAGYYSTQERILFSELLLAGHHPDVAVFLNGVNEFCYPRGEESFSPEIRQALEAPWHARAASLLSQTAASLADRLPLTHLWWKIRDGLKARVRQAGRLNAAVPLASAEAEAAAIVTRYLRNTRLTGAMAASHAITPIFVWQPMPAYGYDLRSHLFSIEDALEDYPHVVEGYRHLARLRRQQDLGANFLWCADMQRGLAELLYVTSIHYTARMSQRIAEALVEHMLARRLLTQTSP